MTNLHYYLNIVGFIALLLLEGCPAVDDSLVVLPGRSRVSASLKAYESCSQLESALKKHFKDELRNRLLILKNQNKLGYPVPLAAGAAEDSAGPRVEGVDYSGTNNQETGVDEADFVKTDGFFIYLLNGNSLEIIGTPQQGTANYLSRLSIEGSPNQMLLFGDRLAIFSYANDFGIAVPDARVSFSPIWMPQKTKITVVKLDAVRKNPSIEREWYFDGNFIAARKIQNKIFAVSHYSPVIKDVIEYPEMPNNVDWNNEAAVEKAWNEAVKKAISTNDEAIERASLDDIVPHFYTKDKDELKPQSLTEGDCQNFSSPEDSVARSFSSIFTLDMTMSELAPEADHILSNSPQLYASSTTLILAEPSEDSWWFFGNPDMDEATNIHRFSVSSLGETTYTGSGRIDGTILNQFSLSEYNGYVRVVSTTGRFNRWFVPEDQRRDSENHVFVLSGENALSLAGKIDGIAKGERIWSSRFVQDKAYLVTFKNIDPLFTIDLADPANPRIIGELKVPGVSTYIHPLDGGFLLNVGYGGNDEMLDWSTNVSLYDVSNFNNPFQFDVLSFAPTTGRQSDGWVSVSSEANYEHKAITYWPPKQLLAIPVSTYRNFPKTNGSFEYSFVSKLKLVRAKAGEKLSLYGEVDHSDFFNSDAMGFYYNPDIRRSIFMGDYIYAISLKGVTANRLSDMQRTAKVALKGFESFL